MGQLPTELVDMIMLKMDVRTLGVLYDRGALMDMVSAPAAREIEEKVLRRARDEHKRLLFEKCLFHLKIGYDNPVWYGDGRNRALNKTIWQKWKYDELGRLGPPGGWGK